MIDGFVGNCGTHIRKHRKACHFHSHMPGDDRLWDCGHAHSVRANGAEVSNLSGRFVCGPRHGGINAFAHINSTVFPGGFELFSQLWIVHLSLVYEARSPSVLIRAAERIYSDEVDVIRDDHQTTANEVRIYGA